MGFGLFSRNLPRLKRGRPIPAETANAWPDAAERGRLVAGRGGGLEATQLPQGTAVRLSFRSHLRVMKLTGGALAAATAPAYTSQTATPYVDTGSSPLVAAAANPVTVKNHHDRAFAANAYVFAAFDGTTWWVIDADGGTGIAAVGGSAIAKRVGGTAGSGSGTIQAIDGGGALTSTGTTVTLFNLSVEKAVNASALVGYKLCDGHAVIDWADCGDLT